MNNLSTVQSNISNGVTATAQPENISRTLQHGLTKAGGRMTTAQMIEASQPREVAITLDRAKSAWLWLWQLKSSRKKVLVSRFIPQGERAIYRSEYSLPEGMTEDAVIKGLTEMVRPCSPTVLKYFVTLQAFKPFFDADAERVNIIYDMIFQDLKDEPEVAVVLALEDLRTAKGKYFPLDEVLPAVLEYRDLIYDALDFFKGEYH
ncbi:hypothetical protein [Dyadobacter sp. 32]|uniref:hypothetical protein n=1 Tax=Dyadobacter sp. 32 TaxID=538966 RepID=UPI0011EF329C